MVPVSQFQSGFPTHSQTEVPSLRGGNASADLCGFSEDSPLCDVTMSDRLPTEREEWLETVNEARQEEDPYHQEHDYVSGSHDGGNLPQLCRHLPYLTTSCSVAFAHNKKQLNLFF